MSDFTPGFYTVEIFGHRTHAGYCTEVNVFGGAMLRIETPALPEIPEARRPVTRFIYDDEPSVNGSYVRASVPPVPIQVYLYGGAAIFSITPCTEEDAIAEERTKHQQNYERWVPDAPEMVALPAPMVPVDPLTAGSKWLAVSAADPIEDEDPEPMSRCPDCRGTGRISDSGKCGECYGTGLIR